MRILWICSISASWVRTYRVFVMSHAVLFLVLLFFLTIFVEKGDLGDGADLGHGELDALQTGRDVSEDCEEKEVMERRGV